MIRHRGSMKATIYSKFSTSDWAIDVVLTNNWLLFCMDTVVHPSNVDDILHITSKWNFKLKGSEVRG